MKSSILLLMLICQFTYAQTIRRVNNTGISTTPASPNTVPIYTTIQAAHDAATAGDIIMVEPSAVEYGNLTATKQLTYYGNGYLLGSLADNKNPNLQAKNVESKISSVVFQSGSEGSIFSGLKMSSAISIYTNNISIIRNYANQINLYNTALNCKIQQNYVAFINCQGSSNNVFQNNIIYQGIVINNQSNNNLVENNVITSNIYGITLNNCIVRNNIDMVNFSSDLAGSTVTNNLAVNAAVFGTSNGNLVSTASAIFEDATNTSNLFSEDTRFKLKVGSPAIGAGLNGTLATDMGAYGGSFPYIPSGIPAIPSIYKIVVPGTVTSNNFNITISTKNNN